MITIRKAKPEDASAIIDFQQKMAWETEQMTLIPELIAKGVKTVFAKTTRGQYWVAEEEGNVETNNSRAQKTYEALGMKSEHYTMYEWLKEY